MKFLEFVLLGPSIRVRGEVATPVDLSNVSIRLERDKTMGGVTEWPTGFYSVAVKGRIHDGTLSSEDRD